MFPISSCDPSTGSKKGTDDSANIFAEKEYSFPYMLNQPETKYLLPGFLEEISGLAYYKRNKLVCIQDEKANIYILELEEELKITTYKFGKDGDFEDIEILEDTAYVLRNDGIIFRVKDFTKEENKVKKYKTDLTENNDTEGLTYDALSNSLLIACKGSPFIDDKNQYNGSKAVYRFDLETNELLTKPHLLIDLNNLNNYSNQNTLNKFSQKVAKKLLLVDNETSFNPSGIAIHPVYGNIYLISSVGKLIIVLNREGKVLYVHELDSKLFRQPEGICFSPSGDLFISNEGQGGKGSILKFKPLTNEKSR